MSACTISARSRIGPKPEDRSSIPRHPLPRHASPRSDRTHSASAPAWRGAAPGDEAMAGRSSCKSALTAPAAGHEGIEGGPELGAVMVLFLEDFVPAARHDEMPAGEQSGSEAFDRRSRDDLVAACRDQQ